MSENTKKAQTILIDDVEHDLEAMTDEQKMLVNHCMDLERKIASAQFSLDQLNVGKQAFISMLKQSLEKKEETVQ
jgi:cell division septum initiation protein DivIVA